ncbi:class I SAM-dependent methyltransferase [Thalassospira mesophila]|uniref:Methyltransferase n=1 Tax=Thalassospira mesophila TaxID=1293891 RepID=A0A1Y2L4R8_9PROT|nr:class I SAM-dependent methyltransferase [Thalassospira mesophila]OSQ40473.1 methyltransferase [Thalassospira mesophila]
MTTYTVDKVLYEQSDFPVFQNRMYATERLAKDCPRGDIKLVEDRNTGLIYNSSFRPELMIYDENYQNEQGVSAHFQNHLEEVSCIVEEYMGRHSLVEVGCGKGLFLEKLLDKGIDVTGFDPTYEGSNSKVQRRYFEPGLGISGTGLILRHVLEHIQDPFNFLMDLKNANLGKGRIYIEVPCFEWICQKKSWFDIFYEHVNYFRISDFYRMFENVIKSGKIFGGQYIYVVAELSSLRTPRRDTDDPVTFPSDFTNSLSERSIGTTAKSAIWGGASKGVIFSLLKSRIGQTVDVVIDINPRKQGKFLPATGIKVQSPEEGLANLPLGSDIYVMNSNYLHEIKTMSNNAYNYVQVDHE